MRNDKERAADIGADNVSTPLPAGAAIDERALFDKWYEREGRAAGRGHKDHQWLAWQARAALSPQAPASDTSGRDAISKQIDEELASRHPQAPAIDEDAEFRGRYMQQSKMSFMSQEELVRLGWDWRADIANCTVDPRTARNMKRWLKRDGAGTCAVLGVDGIGVGLQAARLLADREAAPQEGRDAQDAARYRWLRKSRSADVSLPDENDNDTHYVLREKELDARIDEELELSKGVDDGT